MKSKKLVSSVVPRVNERSRRLNAGQIGLQDAGQKFVEFVNRVGDRRPGGVEGVQGPTWANRIIVDGEVAAFDQVGTGS